MVGIKLIFLIVILMSLICAEISEAATKKQHRNLKRKKTRENGKFKANLRQVAGANQRNGKMNFYNSHLWPSTTTYYRPATTSLRGHLPSTTSSSIFYPFHWGNSYASPSTFMSSNTLRRTDDSSSLLKSTAQSSLMSMPNFNIPLMSVSNSDLPALYDMSAFTGNDALMDRPLINTNQNLWSVGETMAATPKPKFNSINHFNYNDDNMFEGFLNK